MRSFCLGVYHSHDWQLHWYHLIVKCHHLRHIGTFYITSSVFLWFGLYSKRGKRLQCSDNEKHTTRKHLSICSISDSSILVCFKMFVNEFSSMSCAEWLHSSLHGSPGESPRGGTVPSGEQCQPEYGHWGTVRVCVCSYLYVCQSCVHLSTVVPLQYVSMHFLCHVNVWSLHLLY